MSLYLYSHPFSRSLATFPLFTCLSSISRSLPPLGYYLPQPFCLPSHSAGSNSRFDCLSLSWSSGAREFATSEPSM
ncbi:hypothetical protein EX30DRAFT_343389 [Ascodesmis nigricans]|uniref:Uncharacterized protein n=1 Tax=Ascodesmis nigricans TaxID=341454 RepID=A0A4S2MM59_9PEZI|nr:hypothetical protein EX30DRAFT_343389 [Ascodesmis nigricans]